MRLARLFCVCLLPAVVGCTPGGPRAEDQQALVDRLADVGKGYAPPGALEAHARLKRLGTRAFATLVHNARDERPACPCFQRDTSNRTTVGEACAGIISTQVEKFTYQKVGPHYLIPENLRDWWQTSEDKSLRTLQIEAIEWTIAQIETNDLYAAQRQWRLPRLKEDLRRLRAPP